MAIFSKIYYITPRVLFWIAGSVIKGKTLNGLVQFDCINLPYSPNASTIDPVNRRLYYIVVTSSMVTVGQIGYSTFDCSGGLVISLELFYSSITMYLISFLSISSSCLSIQQFSL